MADCNLSSVLLSGWVLYYSTDTVESDVLHPDNGDILMLQVRQCGDPPQRVSTEGSPSPRN